MTSAAIAVLAPLLAISPTTVPPCGFCPQVTEVHRANSLSPFNVVFLSSGFRTPDEMQLYRCAVDRLVSGWLGSEPWVQHSCAIGVYRIDAIADDSGISADAGCASCAPGPTTIKSSDICTTVPGSIPFGPGIPIWPGTFCGTMSQDIAVRHCVDGYCQLVWPTDFGKLKALLIAGACAPSPNAIVIVANSNLAGGGGDLQLYHSGPEFAVVTIDNIRESGAWRRLAHEMGHVLGLLDEYVSSETDPISLPYECERNLYSPVFAAAAAVPCTDSNTWETKCTDPGDLKCPAPSSGACQVVCNTGGAVCCFHEPTSTSIALFEGAFYQAKEVYRSEFDCIMNNYATGEMCGRCQEYGDAFLDSSVGPCVEPFPHDLFIKGAAAVDLERCGSVPRPPVPPSDVFSAVSSACPEIGHRVLGFRALVKVKGVPGLEAEVRVRSASFTVADPKKPSKRATYELSVSAKGGTPVLTWTRKKKPVDLSKIPAVVDGDTVRLGIAAAPLTVVDVAGKSWEASQLIITTASSAPVAPNPHD